MTDFSLEDTIVAISTAPGEAAIGIVRLSGPQALSIISRIFKPAKAKDITKVPSHTIHYGWVISRNTGEIIDEVLVSIMKAPNTYTREDVVEINCHGGMVPLRKVLELAVKEGARIAKPGEFTLRAFINGRIDLAQAEAVLDLIRAKTDWSSTLALKQLQGGLSEKLNSLRQAIMNVTAHVEAYLDFPEEEIEPMTEAQILTQLQDILNEIQGLAETFYEGRLLREGLSVAIVGRPNVGKSSLLNKLLERDRAIVTDIPGTTRDVIEEYLNIKGLPIKVLDTAGIRASKDMIEEEGIRRSLKAIEEADLVLCVLDQSEPIQEEDRRIMGSLRDKKTVFVLNKADLPARLDRKLLPPDKPSVVVSAKSGEGISSLKETIYNEALGETSKTETLLITNARHKKALDSAAGSLQDAISCFKRKEPLEFVAMQLREALSYIGEITGQTTPDDILNIIFSEFCIGK